MKLFPLPGLLVSRLRFFAYLVAIRNLSNRCLARL